MLPYYGKPSNLDGYPASPKTFRRGATTFILRGAGRNEEQLTSKFSAGRSHISGKTLPHRGKKIRINVSGKMYNLTLQQLQNFPKSLLADPVKREVYHDAENDEIFFDRNRTTFESVYYFYATCGMLVFPTKTFSQQLVADELYFFGLYDYLSPEEKDHSLPLPSALLTKKPRVNPRRICQKKVWETCEFPESSNAARIVNLFSLLVIVFAVVILCIDTLPSGRNAISGQDNFDRTRVNHNTARNTTRPSYNTTSPLKSFLSRAEECCIAWFTIELIARFVVSPKKRKFLQRFLNIVDVVAILPFYISLIASSSHNTPPVYVIKIFHLSKIFQVLKLSRYTSTMKVLGKTVKACLYDLWTVVFLTLIGTILFGSVVYYCEQWDKETDFHSIPDACWWAVVTITTLGYGDMIPNTLGKYIDLYNGNQLV